MQILYKVQILILFLILLLLDEKIAADKNLEASQIIKQHIAPLIKGGGGGQKTLASASGADPGKLSAVIDKIRQLI